MANIVTHAVGSEVATIASGEHIVTGHLWASKTEGADPTHRVYIRQILGYGEWEAVERVWYDNGAGVEVIKPEDYIFHDGTQTESGAFFPEDSPHTGFVMVDLRLPEGFEEADTKKNPPTGTRVKAKTQKFPDFDSEGNQIDNNGVIVSTIDEPIDWTKIYYTASPGRVIVGRSFKFGNIKRTRPNWEKWVEYRDFCANPQPIDYRTLEGLEGFGLTGTYFNGANFESEIVKRIDKSVFFALSAGAPASGVGADNFSVRWEGFIKPKFTGTYTFTLIHTHGARLVIGGETIIDQLAGAGTHTGAFEATANAFEDILVEWTHTTGDAEIVLKWQSDDVPIEIIKPENLYPSESEEAAFELHDHYSTPTELDQMIDSGLLHTNSIKQEVEGKMEFYCVEQLQPSFHFDYSLPETENPFVEGTFNLERSKVKPGNRQNVFEATFGNLGTEYLEDAANSESQVKPIRLIATELRETAGRDITGEPLPLPNMTVMQAYKVLGRIMGLTTKDRTPDFDATKKAHPVIAGDIVTMTRDVNGFEVKEFIAVQSRDYSPDEFGGKRHLKLKEI